MSLTFIREKCVTSPPPENSGSDEERELGEKNREMCLWTILRWGILTEAWLTVTLNYIEKQIFMASKLYPKKEAK